MRLKLSVLIPTLLLSLFGILMIYSASSYAAEVNLGDAFFYVKKQALAFAVGVGALLFGSRIKTEWLKKLKYIIYGVSLALLLILFIPGVGSASYGATRWINLGFISFQPSEFSKFGLVIFLAAYMSEHTPNKLINLIVPLFAGLAICVAIMLEPNMSVTMCVGATLLVMLFIGGIRPLFAGIFCGGVAAAVPLLIVAEPYRMKRLLAFIDPWATPKAEGYQLIQSYYALGAGGLFGVGLFASRQKYLYLPFSESDFIFPVIGEELGLIGAIAVIAVFGVLTVGGIMIAMRSDDRFESLLAGGITTLIAAQTILNVAVVSGMVPPTGLPLPYVSAGGSSLIMFMFASGLLINIARRQQRQVLRIR